VVVKIFEKKNMKVPCNLELRGIINPKNLRYLASGSGVVPKILGYLATANCVVPETLKK